MKFLRYGQPGQERPAVLDSDGNARDISSLVADINAETIGSLAALDLENISNLPLVDLSERIGPCVGGSSKFICIGLNYADHAAETGAPIPEEPIIFLKAISAICGPNDDLMIPPGSQKTDWEVELGIIIGKTARHVSIERAHEYIAGFCLINDVSEREYQIERGGQWDKGKGYDSFGPIGPWLVTPDEIPDPHNLHMWLEVDGRRYQNGNTNTMIFKVRELVSYASQFMSLLPGDVISTGTPPGVGLGQRPPVYLRAGQTIELCIEGLGVQKQRTIPSPYSSC
jgi:2-keto-4-pentenoate hydratase/2-oxohepta-3-ene-1,7-dioic acid hydratase in catechol pathway